MKLCFQIRGLSRQQTASVHAANHSYCGISPSAKSRLSLYSRLRSVWTNKSRRRRLQGSLVDERVSETAAARIVGLRCRAADAVCRRSLAGDTDQMSALGRALDRLSVLADRLRSDLGRVGRTSSASLDALHRRLGYHAAAALQGGVRRVFQDAFVSEFDRVRRRSLDPLMVLEHEAVANVERTIKQLHFTATSESVARKVQSRDVI